MPSGVYERTKSMKTGKHIRTKKMNEDVSRGVKRQWSNMTPDEILKRNKKQSKTLKKMYKRKPWMVEEKRKQMLGKNNPMFGIGGMKGKTHSPETILKMKAVKLGKVFTVQHRENLSKAQIKRKQRDGYIQSPESRMKIKMAKIKKIEASFGKIQVSYNPLACKFFESLNEKFNLKGQHAQNKGEFRVLSYHVDYYEPILNLVIEWNEKGHYGRDNRLTERHKKRQKEITRFLKCRFININQKAFNEQNVFNRVKKISEANQFRIIFGGDYREII